MGGRHPPVSVPGRGSCTWRPSPGCCTKKAVGYAIGATARGTDSVVRGDRYGGPQVPAHDRRRRYSTRFHSGRGCQYTSEQLAQHLGRYEIIASTGRTGVRWAGAWAEVGGRYPQGTRGSIRWCIPQEARPSGILPPRSSPVHTIRNNSALPWGTGRRARPTRSTEQQDEQPERPLSGLSETRPAVQMSGVRSDGGSPRTSSTSSFCALIEPRRTLAHGVTGHHEGPPLPPPRQPLTHRLPRPARPSPRQHPGRHHGQRTQPPPPLVPAGLQSARTPPPPDEDIPPPSCRPARDNPHARSPRKHQPGIPQQLPQNAILFNSSHHRRPALH